MRWRDRRQSSNIEDRRAFSGGKVAVGGGLGGLVLIVLVLLFGGDPTQFLTERPSTSNEPAAQAPLNSTPEEEELKKFVSVVLAETEDVWRDIFRELGEDYREPTIVLFRDQVASACGRAGSSIGPFYCPADQKVYIDLAFFEDLRSRFRAPGDFAQAYVIAHEVGHHVQNLLGTMGRVNRMRAMQSETAGNRLSVRLELQADYFAGVWAHHAQKRGILEPGDVEEALGAASAIGDDRLQRESRGHVVPDSFTHGTSEQRIRWFRRGMASGDPRQGDTFNIANP